MQLESMTGLMDLLTLLFLGIYQDTIRKTFFCLHYPRAICYGIYICAQYIKLLSSIMSITQQEQWKKQKTEVGDLQKLHSILSLQ